jgi:hypothetical protein
MREAPPGKGDWGNRVPPRRAPQALDDDWGNRVPPGERGRLQTKVGCCGDLGQSKRDRLVLLPLLKLTIHLDRHAAPRR